MENCKCKEPMLQPETRQCGKCKLYIDRVRHILLTSYDINVPTIDVPNANIKKL